MKFFCFITQIQNNNHFENTILHDDDDDDDTTTVTINLINHHFICIGNIRSFHSISILTYDIASYIQNQIDYCRFLFSKMNHHLPSFVFISKPEH